MTGVARLLTQAKRGRVEGGEGLLGEDEQMYMDEEKERLKIKDNAGDEDRAAGDKKADSKVVDVGKDGGGSEGKGVDKQDSGSVGKKESKAVVAQADANRGPETSEEKGVEESHREESKSVGRGASEEIGQEHSEVAGRDGEEEADEGYGYDDDDFVPS